ncbi:excisionase family DNA-binding protein [Nitrospira sp. Nam80]
MDKTGTAEKWDMKADELASCLNCGKSTVYYLAKKNRIPSIVIGKRGRRFNYGAAVEALKAK